MQSNIYFPTDVCHSPNINHPEVGFAVSSHSVPMSLPFHADSTNLLCPLTFDEPEDWSFLSGYPHEIPQEYQSDGYVAWASFPMSMPMPQSSTFSEIPPYSPPSSTNLIPQNNTQRGTSVTTPFTPAVRRRARKSNRLSKEQRSQSLQNDEFVLSFTAVQVFCAG
jgi:hypothetical protein